METKKDISYGVIPIRKEAEQWKVFLINQFSRIGNNTYWVLPKGHPEVGESPLQAAARELKEETNLVAHELISEPTFKSEYSFIYEGVKIEKSVIFFIGLVNQVNVVLDPNEVRDAGWFTFAEAYERLDYEVTKKLFKEAAAYIEQNV